ncbi:MAG: hypothetical protein ACPL3P_06890 [Anaerolineales bacterium]
MIDSSALILVAVIKSPRDLEIARLLGWYRIPLRSAPKIIAVDYLAFYQTAAFKVNKWCIQFIAPIKGYELTTRAELLQEELSHPNAHQEYYKIQLGTLEELEQPIQATDWKRITFFYTTGAYFSNARTISDLILHEEERLTLWRSLRERAQNNYQLSGDIELPEDIDTTFIAQLLGLKSSQSR